MINPQNGHILGGPKSVRGVFLAKNFPREPARNLRKLRRWTEKGCRTSLLFRVFYRFTMTRRRQQFCARLLKLREISRVACRESADLDLAVNFKVSNSDQLFF